ncbi:MAG TPA: ATP-binding protein [Chitinophagales bacterium]|nr:ATP-binding protein [Chitinophagales bacterium]
MAAEFIPSIGKNVIETLTMGMYDDPRFIFREYVQNSADQIDAATKSGIFAKKEDGDIHILIDKKKKQIIIEDNATGIESAKVQAFLGNIAQSPKNRYLDKGFRGIGRLGGLGYCDKLTFETSYKGEKIKSTMVWDAKQLREIINDTSIRIEAAELISAITNYSKESEAENTHYFKVILDDVTNDDLLSVNAVREYLSMVAPVPFSNNFSFKTKIYQEAEKEKIIFDEYTIYINEDQLFKAYKNSVFNKGNIVDEIYDVEFYKSEVEMKGEANKKAKKHKEVLFWCWYGISKNMRQIPEENFEKFLRLRKHNIQIGLENRLDDFHKDDTGNRYFIGEVHALNSRLVPNARRDFFEDNSILQLFKQELRDFFYSTLYNLYYDFSKKNSSIKDLKETEKFREEYSHKIKDKFISKEEREILGKEAVKKEQKAEKAKKELIRLQKEYPNSTLSRVIKETSPIDLTDPDSHPIVGNTSKVKTKETNRLSDSEKKLLARIFKVIANYFDKKTSDTIIQKIKDELQ